MILLLYLLMRRIRHLGVCPAEISFGVDFTIFPLFCCIWGNCICKDTLFLILQIHYIFFVPFAYSLFPFIDNTA